VLFSVTAGVGTLRLLALLLSALASWLLFSYAYRLYDRRVALIATALFSTSFLWMAHADSIHQAPLMQCMGLLALWGTVRAVETNQLRHHVAVGLGTFACLLTAYDYYLVLPVGVIATVYAKRGSRRIVAVCAAAAIAAIVTTCLLGHVPRIAQSYNRELVTALPAIARRATLGLTPLLWIAVGFHFIRAIRADTLAGASRDSIIWLVPAAVIWLVWFSPRAASHMIALQVLLLFYAIGSALVVARLLDGGSRLRKLGLAWLVAAPLWSFYWTFTQPRAVLARDDVAEANAYLAAHDANDFVLSNLLDDAPIEAAFRRHTLDALTSKDPMMMLRVFELTGTDAVHAIIFTEPSSRFFEPSLLAITRARAVWSVRGWPQIARHKTNALIHEYDQKVLASLAAVNATKVLQLRGFAIYRIERAATLAVFAESVPATSRLDFDTVDSLPHELLGWDPLRESDEVPPGATLHDVWRCREKACKTVMTERGLVVPKAERVQVGQLMIRLDHACDLRLTARFAEAGVVRFNANGFSTQPVNGNPVTVTIPAGSLTTGVNLIELENLRPLAIGAPLRVLSLDLSPCESP